MLRRHSTTLEYEEKQDDYILNIDGYSIHLTQKDMNQLAYYVGNGNRQGSEQIAEYLKGENPELYDQKLAPLATNPNILDVFDVLECQFTKPIYTQKPE